jgi:hypothetical protein
MLVFNAHRVTDESGEGFAVRLYRAGRPGGPLVAFSDAPNSFRLGLNKVRARGRGRPHGDCVAARCSAGLLGQPQGPATSPCHRPADELSPSPRARHIAPHPPAPTLPPTPHPPPPHPPTPHTPTPTHTPQLEKVMRSLQLRRLLLYPRFHEAVAADLEADAAEVGGEGGGGRWRPGSQAP